MKKTTLFLILLSTLVSCGKANKVNTGETNVASGVHSYTNGINQFEGNYDLIKMGSDDCGASIRIVKDCEGLMVLSNNHDRPEEFCHINKGKFKSTTVTLTGNELKAMTEVSAEKAIIFTNTLTLNSDNTLYKISNLKSRKSRCVYLKR